MTALFPGAASALQQARLNPGASFPDPWEVARANYEAQLSVDNSFARSTIFGDAYDDLIERLGVDLPNPYRTDPLAGGLGGGSLEDAERRIWAEIDRRRQAGEDFPASREEFEAQLLEDARQKEEYASQLMERSSTSGMLLGFMGRLGAGAQDPVNVLSIGAGGGATVARRIVSEAIINAGIEGATFPGRAQWRGELGLPQGNILHDMAFGAALGAGFAGATEGIGAAINAMRRQDLVRTFRERVQEPTPVQQAAADRIETQVAVERAGSEPETPSGAARLEETLDRVQRQMERRETPTVEPRIEGLAGAEARVWTPSGRPVDVRYELVEADELITSNRPEFPPELQPRDRTRAASEEQIQSLVARLEPERLGASTESGTGAPIIGADNVVESGNGRVMALARSYERNTPRIEAYRDYLRGQGFDVEGMRRPVLVRRRTTEMDQAQREAFAQDSNARTTAAMGAAEQALADARLMDDDLLSLVRGADPFAAGNRPFVRGFMERLPQSERAALMTAEGELSTAGAQRVSGALLARAYGDANLVGRLLESRDPELGTLGGAMLLVAPRWAKMRALAARGEIAIEGDGTAGLLEAARSVIRSRETNQPLEFALMQQDAFGDGLSPDAMAFLERFITFDKRGRSRLIGRDRLAERLTLYLDAAEKQHPGPNMFGEHPATPAALLHVLMKAEDRVGVRQGDLDVGRGAEQVAPEPAGAERAADVPEQVMEDGPAVPVAEEIDADGNRVAVTRTLRELREEAVKDNEFVDQLGVVCGVGPARNVA